MWKMATIGLLLASIASPAVALANARILIEKSTNGLDADTPPGPQILVGQLVTWTYEVTNIGGGKLSSVTVMDDQGVAVACPQDTLEIGESMICTASAPATAGQYSNVGTAFGTSPGLNVKQDTDPSHYFGVGPRRGCGGPPTCGDGVVNTAAETCDEGSLNSQEPDAMCRLDCTPQRCGDGVVDTFESCDDGNDVDGDACQNTCASCEAIRNAGLAQCEQTCEQFCGGDFQFELFCKMYNCTPAWNAWLDACTAADDEPPRPDNVEIADGACP